MTVLSPEFFADIHFLLRPVSVSFRLDDIHYRFPLYLTQNSKTVLKLARASIVEALRCELVTHVFCDQIVILSVKF